MEQDSTLFKAMRDGATLITPTNRLSNQLLHDFFNAKASTAMPKPRCLPYQTFLRDRFKKVRHHYPTKTHPLLLTQAQYRHLWREVVIEHTRHCSDGLMERMADAWASCQAWRLDCNDEAFANTPQTRLFQQCQQTFQQRLDNMDAITEEQLATYLIAYPQVFHDIHTLLWVCFDDYTPLQCALQDALQAEGCQQHHHDLPPKPTLAHQYTAKNLDDEYVSMMAWLKQKLAEGNTRIGLIVPDLETQSASLERLLQEHLLAHQFNVSLGKPLTNTPLVSHALHWLSLDGKTLSNHQARLLLHSPFLKGAESEFAMRADAMQHLSLLKEPTLSFQSFIDALEHTAPLLSATLRALNDYPKEASPATWVTHFKKRLNIIGFPGDYPLESGTYQCFQRLMLLFDDYQPLSVITPLMNQDEALQALRELSTATIFQLKTPTAPVQILGLLEASGCRFQSLWVCGLTDQCLPKRPHFSAFIPLHVQKEQAMPHAVLEREWQLAEQSLMRLLHGSDDCVFSYPCFMGDLPQLPSPLITHLPALALTQSRAPTFTTHLIAQEESYCLPLAPTELVSGGTTLLANQAMCPFRAFAAHRLHAKPAPIITEGIDPSERGQLMHRLMEYLWQHLRTQQHLLSITSQALDNLIDEAIQYTLAPFFDKHPLYSSLIKTLEASRLKRLATACLAWEKERPPFEVVALEKEFTLSLAGIDFRVRIDRLDRINENTTWVIDYKSRLPTKKPWNDDRPEAPQLLLYALLDDHIHALIFLELRAGRLTCSGLSEDALSIQGINALKKDEHWNDKKETWRQQLTQLADEFGSGHCPPTPTHAATCDRCDFQSICRVT